jgi:hypothetical protein
MLNGHFRCPKGLVFTSFCVRLEVLPWCRLGSHRAVRRAHAPAEVRRGVELIDAIQEIIGAELRWSCSM